MDTGFRVRPAQRIAGVECYDIPRPSAPIDLWLNGNEGSAPGPEILASLVDRGPEILRRYPESQELEAILAARHGVSPENVIVTAGADEALDRICRAILEPGREIVLPVPTFEMFELSTVMAGGTLIGVPWQTGPCPVQQILDKVGDRTAALAIVTPNNPTGLAVEPGDLERLAAGAPDALLIVDLAYCEFAEVDLMPTVLSLPNAVALRTLSKAWGLAGLRVGYAVGPAPLIQWLRCVGGPYPVAQISRLLAMQRLQTGKSAVAAFVNRVRAERDDLFGLLHQLGANPLPSQGNFVFARPGDAAWLTDGLAGLGIAIRSFPGRPYLGDAVRITCPGSGPDWARLQHALRTVLAPQALLFDMDGVLADVSGSYRKAIAETARSFGVSITAEDVSAAKAAGNANNDWDLTHSLLSARGMDIPFDEVKERFECLYQGTDEQPGLWESERLLCSVELLQQLSRALPLAVVTGRPRADAIRFLEGQGIASLFQELVCLEDGPAKPDPAPVRLALERLGVQRAWLVGDTPDDMKAARAAGVLPLAVLAPGEQAPETAQALRDAGAARILDSLTALTRPNNGANRPA